MLVELECWGVLEALRGKIALCFAVARRPPSSLKIRCFAAFKASRDVANCPN